MTVIGVARSSTSCLIFFFFDVFNVWNLSGGTWEFGSSLTSTVISVLIIFEACCSYGSMNIVFTCSKDRCGFCWFRPSLVVGFHQSLEAKRCALLVIQWEGETLVELMSIVLTACSVKMWGNVEWGIGCLMKNWRIVWGRECSPVSLRLSLRPDLTFFLLLWRLVCLSHPRNVLWRVENFYVGGNWEPTKFAGLPWR